LVCSETLFSIPRTRPSGSDPRALVPWDGEGFAPSRRPPRRRLSTWFGFSWNGPFCLRKPQLLGVGFPWISLDSLVRNDRYQWVTRDFRPKFFPRAFVAWKSRRNGDPTIRHAKRTDCSCGKLTSISDFLQEIAAPPPSKSKSFQSVPAWGGIGSVGWNRRIRESAFNGCSPLVSF
jgi:hypothetical protein